MAEMHPPAIPGPPRPAARRRSLDLGSRAAWLVAMVALSVVLISLFRVYGAVIAVAAVVMWMVVVSQRDTDREMDPIRRSITLSSHDIATTLAEWRDFCTSDRTECRVDRTHHRPELLNPDSRVASVVEFHEAVGRAQDFLDRLPAETRHARTVNRLRDLLAETDRHAADIDALWHRARRDASRPT
ncbi:hypothetical protein QP948_04285 [Corynebacterium bovis]|uniref:hypothetical protein n=1 Tax=Corynebacterium bovis TaxID=36808 RepID=UPI0025507A87|nr:hypothetical protein [Corynebacterium bovis]MDK8510623.1 hypothetical protein [Corynebacterium bovis]